MWEDGPGGDERRRRTWLVRTRVKLVASVETRSQVTMLGPTVVQPCVWLGSVTWYARAEAARAARARTVRMMKGCKGGRKRGLQGRRARRRRRSKGRKERGDVEDAGVKREGSGMLTGSGLKRTRTGRDGGHPSPARRRTWLDPRSHSPQREHSHTEAGVENIRIMSQNIGTLARRNMSSASTIRLNPKWTSPRP